MGGGVIDRALKNCRVFKRVNTKATFFVLPGTFLRKKSTYDGIYNASKNKVRHIFIYNFFLILCVNTYESKGI